VRGNFVGDFLIVVLLPLAVMVVAVLITYVLCVP